jgi:hypothetical protein
MREYGTVVYLRTPDGDITRELLMEAGALVQASFDHYRSQHKELLTASYRFVAGDYQKVGNDYFHPFGWYAQSDGAGDGD